MRRAAEWLGGRGPHRRWCAIRDITVESVAETHTMCYNIDGYAARHDLVASDGFSDFKFDRIPIEKKRTRINCNFYRVAGHCLIRTEYIARVSPAICISFRIVRAHTVE